uniref:TPM domain-containing protein n=1 Tax=Plectus sambesii TaxID=2011161 RepID=A0A914VI82_9BILA
MFATLRVYMLCLNLLLCGSVVFAQSDPTKSGWTTKDYPDPRIDFAKCGSNSPGFLCDPDGLLREEDRIALKGHVEDVERQSKKVFNKSQFCSTGAPDGLQFFIVLMNKMDGSTVGQTETKLFAQEIKAKYDIFKDVNTCDTTVVIVSSKNDGQLYTVAGRDAQLPGSDLENAFNQNTDHFAKGNFAAGLKNMITQLEAAYEVAHTSTLVSNNKDSTTNSTVEGANGTQKDDDNVTDSNSTATNGEANGSSNVADNLTTTNNASLTNGESPNSAAEEDHSASPLQVVTSSGNNENEALPTLVPLPDDTGNLSNNANAALPGSSANNLTLTADNKSLWLNIVQITGIRCGTQNDPDAFMRNVRLVVEEIRDLSAQLERDDQYKNILKMVLKSKGDPDGDTKAWNVGGRPFIEPLRQSLINQESPPLSTACVNDIFN